MKMKIIKFVSSVLAMILMFAGLITMGYAWFATPDKMEIREYRQSYDMSISDRAIADIIAADNPYYLTTLESVGVVLLGVAMCILGFYILQKLESSTKSLPSRKGVD